jgi:hypothetical protein
MAVGGVGEPSMSRQEVDRALASLGAEHDRLAAAMYAMDTHPAHALLAGADTAGATKRAWQDVQSLMTELWVRFSAFGAGLDVVRAARSRRSRPGADELADLTHLLTGAVVAADPTGAAPGSVPLREAASRLAAGCETVTEVFDRVVAAHTAVTAELGPIASDLAELERLMIVIADPPELRAVAGPWAINADPECAAAVRADAEELVALREQLAAVGAAAAADPLGAVERAVVSADPRGPAAELRRLAAAASGARARLVAAVKIKTDLPDRLAALGAAVRTLATAEDEVRRSYAVALEKIAEPGLPPAPVNAAALAARLAEVERTLPPAQEPLGAAVLERLDAALAAVERDVDAARRRAADLRTAADGLLDRRAELRGRLDAYRVKGARLGFAEHPDLSARHRLAYDLLHTRPCNLPAATRAVHGYQHLLATLAGPEEERMRA